MHTDYRSEQEHFCTELAQLEKTHVAKQQAFNHKLDKIRARYIRPVQGAMAKESLQFNRKLEEVKERLAKVIPYQAGLCVLYHGDVYIVIGDGLRVYNGVLNITIRPINRVGRIKSRSCWGTVRHAREFPVPMNELTPAPDNHPVVRARNRVLCTAALTGEEVR